MAVRRADQVVNSSMANLEAVLAPSALVKGDHPVPASGHAQPNPSRPHAGQTGQAGRPECLVSIIRS